MADDMGFNIPFKGAQESQNPVCKTGYRLHCRRKDSGSMELHNHAVRRVEEWFGSALTAYAADQTDAKLGCSSKCIRRWMGN